MDAAQPEDRMSTNSPEQNKRFVLQAFDTLFNRRDCRAAEKFWSDTYIQHSAHIEPGRDGLFNLVRAAPAGLRYENSLIFAQDDYVMLHGRFTGNGQPRALIAADVVRMFVVVARLSHSCRGPRFSGLVRRNGGLLPSQLRRSQHDDPISQEPDDRGWTGSRSCISEQER
jgi:predicted SnoaL-like aldol condensation-catalyzing enzyme